jgi:transketolase N-terminal domain/subunit
MARTAARVADQSERGRELEKSQTLNRLCINTIRTLSADAVQAANSGHPGAPMAPAPLIYTLWQQFMRFDPEDPEGIDLIVVTARKGEQFDGGFLG